MAVVGAVTVVLTGCGSSSSGSTGASSTTDGSGTTASTASRAGGTSPAIDVDLTISGDVSVRLKGSKGTCHLSKEFGDSYSFDGTDYPALGTGGVMGLGANRPAPSGGIARPDIKLVVGTDGFLTGSETSGIVVESGGRMVRINQTLSGSTNGGPLKTVRLTGTIRCAS